MSQTKPIDNDGDDGKYRHQLYLCTVQIRFGNERMTDRHDEY